MKNLLLTLLLFMSGLTYSQTVELADVRDAKIDNVLEIK